MRFGGDLVQQLAAAPDGAGADAHRHGFQRLVLGLPRIARECVRFLRPLRALIDAFAFGERVPRGLVTFRQRRTLPAMRADELQRLRPVRGSLHARPHFRARKNASTWSAWKMRARTCWPTSDLVACTAHRGGPPCRTLFAQAATEQ